MRIVILGLFEYTLQREHDESQRVTNGAVFGRQRREFVKAGQQEQREKSVTDPLRHPSVFVMPYPETVQMLK